ncbi:hypothetical protein ACOI1C_00360 [Bacillus sp. DJP31]|uniref:hypothetical protein n=1 Tax=Bacillus sp. DJP31 TaxID=3409789 RepID=UPI003BB56C2B
MSTCRLDHSLEDVMNKLTDQKNYLPTDIHNQMAQFLSLSPSQTKLNELFHVLKKYDLATDADRIERNQRALIIITE